MSNTFITPTAVAKVALIALLNNICFAGLVYRDYSKEFKKIGNSVRIRKPAILETVEFDGDLSGEFKNITESYVDVPMDTTLVVPVNVTAHELTLDIVSFQKQVVEPAMQSLADKVDVKLAQLYKDIPYFEDCESSTAISDIVNARKVMNDNKTPFKDTRYAVMSPLTTASLLVLDAFRDLDKTGSNQALRNASLGRLFGYEFYENQNIQTHVIGTTDLAGALTDTEPIGETSLAVDSLGTGTVNKGSIITIEDNTGQYVVTANATITAGAATLVIYPGLNAECASTKVVTIHPALSTSMENLMFHRNAFALVTAPMADPIGGAKGVHMNYKGLTINVVYGYDMNTMQNVITFSILCGFKTLTPELAVRLHDAA